MKKIIFFICFSFFYNLISITILTIETSYPIITPILYNIIAISYACSITIKLMKELDNEIYKN